MNATAFPHVLGTGPLDLLLEVGIPVIVLVVLWAWSARAERGKRNRTSDEPDRRE